MFDSMEKGQAFGFGLVAGILVLCTIGFFILLGIVLSDKNPGDSVPKGSTGTVDSFEAPEKFSKCLDDGKFASAVKQDIQIGSSLGVNGTPGTLINGYLVSGALPYEMVSQVVDSLLAGKEPDFEFLENDAGEIVKVDVPELPNVVWEGNADAEVSLVEFSDFECPFCSSFAKTVHQVLDNYGDKIKFTYRHFPLSFHANAQKAAEAFECAKEQGKWLEMHDKLFDLADAKQLGVENFKKAADELGLK